MEFRERKIDNDHLTNGVTLTVDNFYLISHLWEYNKSGSEFAIWKMRFSDFGSDFKNVKLL